MRVLGMTSVSHAMTSCRKAPLVIYRFPISLKQVSAAMDGRIVKRLALVLWIILVATPAG